MPHNHRYRHRLHPSSNAQLVMPEKFTPMPFQPLIWNWLLEHDRCAVFAGMGMTKTVCTLTAVSELILEGASKGVLIICPLRVGRLAWEAQIERWDHINWMRIANLRTPEGLKSWDEGTSDAYWLNPEKLPSSDRQTKGKTKHHKGFVEKYIKGRKTLPVDTLVIDELTAAKNPKSVRFNSLRPFLHDSPSYKTKFKRVWGLTGTPRSQGYLNIFAQVRLIDPSIFGPSFHQFRQTYFKQVDWMGYKWELQEGAKERIDAKLAGFALALRGSDHLDLPDCTTIDIDVNLPADAMKGYRTLEKDFLLQLEEGDVEALSAAALTTKLLQATAGCLYLTDGGTAVIHDAKIREIKKLIKQHKGEPVLLVGHYIHERERMLKDIPGAVAFHERLVPDWVAGKIPVFVCQPKQMSHGIDQLQHGGRIIIWGTLPHGWETYTQLIHRLLRPGQEHETLVYRILAADTIDWAVAASLKDHQEGEAGMFAAIHALQQLRKTQ